MFSPVWSQDVVGEACLATGGSLVGAFQSYEMCSKRFINSTVTQATLRLDATGTRMCMRQFSLGTAAMDVLPELVSAEVHCASRFLQ